MEIEGEAEVAPQLALAVVPSGEAQAVPSSSADAAKSGRKSKKSRKPKSPSKKKALKVPPPTHQPKKHRTRRQSAASRATELASTQLSPSTPPHLKVTLRRLTKADMAAIFEPATEPKSVTRKTSGPMPPLAKPSSVPTGKAVAEVSDPADMQQSDDEQLDASSDAHSQLGESSCSSPDHAAQAAEEVCLHIQAVEIFRIPNW